MEYRRCNRCLMDTEADANIIFDKDGNCKFPGWRGTTPFASGPETN